MKTKLLLAVVCILTLPIAFSPSGGDKLESSTPYAPVAYAGHTLTGFWCDCGGRDCVCDPGELPGGNRATSVSHNESSDKGPSAIRANARSGPDFGSGALILALALLFWARLRA